MKILAIGDVHGRDNWKEIVKQHFDKLIFIGDYFDSFTIPFNNQLENFSEIVEFKKANIDRVVLLIGNHDYHYLDYTDDRYSGYQSEHADTIHFALKDAIDKGLMQMCSIDDGFLFSHAGISKTWAEQAHIDLSRLEGSINKTFLFTPQMFKFMNYQGADPTGDNIWQSPIWIRPHSLRQDRIEGYVQVVGHTTMHSIRLDGDIFIDCPKEYLEINDKKVYVKKIHN